MTNENNHNPPHAQDWAAAVATNILSDLRQLTIETVTLALTREVEIAAQYHKSD